MQRYAVHESDYISKLRSLLASASFVDLVGEAPPCRDPKDMVFLHCAAVADADFLVSRDTDLLVLRQLGRCGILTPEDLLARLRNPSATT